MIPILAVCALALGKWPLPVASQPGGPQPYFAIANKTSQSITSNEGFGDRPLTEIIASYDTRTGLLQNASTHGSDGGGIFDGSVRRVSGEYVATYRGQYSYETAANGTTAMPAMVPAFAGGYWLVPWIYARTHAPIMEQIVFPPRTQAVRIQASGANTLVISGLAGSSNVRLTYDPCTFVVTHVATAQ